MPLLFDFVYNSDGEIMYKTNNAYWMGKQILIEHTDVGQPSTMPPCSRCGTVPKWKLNCPRCNNNPMCADCQTKHWICQQCEDKDGAVNVMAMFEGVK